MRSFLCQSIPLPKSFGGSVPNRAISEHWGGQHGFTHSRFTITFHIGKNGHLLVDYRIVEVWTETAPETASEHLIVRLKGPHHGSEPRVQIVEPKNLQYVSILSERDGPPYEVWTAPEPIPKVLKLQCGNKMIEITRRRE